MAGKSSSVSELSTSEIGENAIPGHLTLYVWFGFMWLLKIVGLLVIFSFVFSYSPEAEAKSKLITEYASTLDNVGQSG